MISRSFLLLATAVIVTTIAAGGSAVFAQEDVAPDQPQAAAPRAAAPKRAPVKPVIKPVAPKPVAQAQVPPSQPAPSAPASGTPAQLPNGASSITESYGDWTVNCRVDNGQKVCLLSQAQGNKQTGQRSFAIELLAPRDGKTNGTILMPFGLKLDAGAVVKLDDKDLGQGLRFSTCVPEGCLLPVSFPTATIDAMKKATALTVASLNLNNDQAVTFSVSLNGFPAALKRVSDLGS